MADKRVIFKYEFAESYNPVYANGAQGGLTPQGEIALNFFLERLPVPRRETFPINDAGEIGDRLVVEPSDDAEAVFVRYVSMGVVMTVDTARRLKELIALQVKAFEQLQSKANEQPVPSWMHCR